jgi:hypothetical protein
MQSRQHLTTLRKLNAILAFLSESFFNTFPV